MAKRRRPLPPLPLRHEEPYREFWQSLSPRERLRRAWRLRKRVPDIRKLHDEKLVPAIGFLPLRRLTARHP